METKKLKRIKGVSVTPLNEEGKTALRAALQQGGDLKRVGLYHGLFRVERFDEEVRFTLRRAGLAVLSVTMGGSPGRLRRQLTKHPHLLFAEFHKMMTGCGCNQDDYELEVY